MILSGILEWLLGKFLVFKKKLNGMLDLLLSTAKKDKQQEHAQTTSSLLADARDNSAHPNFEKEPQPLW